MKGATCENGSMEKLDVEDQDKKTPYPKGVFFIMATELSERFSYYGMRAVLTIYMRNVLSFSEDQATSYYHVFLMLAYGLTIFLGIISDSWLGKFKTILYVSILFAVGNIILTLSSIPPLNLPTKPLFFAGLLFMGIGTAGMKPCVAPLGGEQFILPQQTKQLSQFFSVFFFVVTVGNMISTIITPIFRRDVECFGMENCYPLAFGVPAATMIFAIVIFLCGKSLYVTKEPSGNMLVKVTKCIVHALSNRKKKTGQHWLDSASDIYDQQIISDTKGLLRVLPYFLPVPMFFALYEQLGSRWTLQATRMTGKILMTGAFSIKPDQMQVSNAILMFISLPLFNWAVYPLLAKFGLNLRSLQKMVIGGILAALSFTLAGIVEMKIEPAIKSSPAQGNTVVTLVNSLQCPVILSTSGIVPPQNFTVEANSYLTLPPFVFANPAPIFAQTANEKCRDIASWNGSVNLLQKQYQTISVSKHPDNSLSVIAYPFEDDYKKSKDGNARIRVIMEKENSADFNFKSESMKVLFNSLDGDVSEAFNLDQKENLIFSKTEEVDENVYNVTIQSASGTFVVNEELELLNGGSYNLIIHKNDDNKLNSTLVIITPPNDIHILWLLPQYILMAWGEILFIVSGMEFAYTEAPASMKSVVQAIWHLMNACGNVIVIISAQNHGQGSQVVEFFVFAACMFIDAIIFGFMARRYKYVTQDGEVIVMH